MWNRRVHTGNEGGRAIQQELLGRSCSPCRRGVLTPRGVTAVTSGVMSPTEMQLFVPAHRVTRLAEVGLTSGRGAASRNSQGSSGKLPTKRLSSGYFSDSNCLGGNNWQLDIELVIIIYRVVRNGGKCLTRLHIKKTHTLTNQCCCYYIIYIIYIKYIIYKSFPSLSPHNVFITSGTCQPPHMDTDLPMQRAWGSLSDCVGPAGSCWMPPELSCRSWEEPCPSCDSTHITEPA